MIFKNNTCKFAFINIKLACVYEIGVNGSIILQELDSMINSNNSITTEHKNKIWVRVSLKEIFEDRLYFISESTIKRTISSLVKNGYLFCENLNEDNRDRTNWYSLNYDELNKIILDTKGKL